MSPDHLRAHRTDPGAPRVSGDEPSDGQNLTVTDACSPRERG